MSRKKKTVIHTLPANKSMWGLMAFRFKKNKLAMLGLFIIALLILAVLLAPVYVDYDLVYTQNMADRFLSPCAEYWFGTDQLGRDLFARIVYGGRVSLFTGLGSVAIGLVMGILVGGLAGYYGGVVDDILMRICDILMAVPSVLLAMAIVAALGQGVDKMLLAISVTMFSRFTRTTRAAILTQRSQEFIEAARCCGTSSLRIIVKHLLPNVLGVIIVNATLALGTAILAIASLGFLGIGVSPPTPEWGSILAENRANIRYYPYLGVIPGVCIAIAVMGMNFLGDGLRDALDPRTKN